MAGRSYERQAWWNATLRTMPASWPAVAFPMQNGGVSLLPWSPALLEEPQAMDAPRIPMSAARISATYNVLMCFMPVSYFPSAVSAELSVARSMPRSVLPFLSSSR